MSNDKYQVDFDLILKNRLDLKLILILKDIGHNYKNLT